MSIEIKGKVYRNLQEQVEKNKEDIQAVKNDIQGIQGLQEQVEKNKEDIQAVKNDIQGIKDEIVVIKGKTVTIYTHRLTNDVDPNQPIQFSGTITLIGNVVIAVNGVVIVQDVNKYPVVAFDQINEVENTITITGTGNSNVVTIDVSDFDGMNQYILY